LSFVTRPLDNRHLERYMVRIRELAGNQVISKKNSARRILENLKASRPVGILMDQNTSLQEGIFADFFGVPAASSSSLALFALRSDAVVLPGFLTPMQKGRYTIKFLPPVDLVRTGEMSRDIEINTARFNAILEEIIRCQPDSWLWGHKRWKNQPPGNPDLYSLSDRELREFLARSAARKTDVNETTKISKTPKPQREGGGPVRRRVKRS
jgi:KDO2-lipid IV(A) lauroyltransferase